MALNTRIHCFKCKQDKYVTHGANMRPLICNDCAKDESDAKKKEHLDALSKMTTEQRLRRIEEWIYTYTPYSEPRF